MKQAKPKALPAEPSDSADLCDKCGQVHPRCTGHKSRKRTDGKWVPCMQWPLKTSSTGKCKNCGGASLKGAAHPAYVDGRHSKYQFLPNKMASRVEMLSGDAIKNLQESIDIQRTLETRALERLGTGESTQAWTKLKQHVERYQNPPGQNEYERLLARSEAFEMIAFCVEKGLSESFIVRDIQSIQESQRKLTETLTKCRKDIQETFTLQQRDEFLFHVIRVIRNNVTDSRALNGIENELLLLTSGNGVSAPVVEATSKRD